MNSFQKQAASSKTKLLTTLASALAGGTGTSLLMDTMMHPDQEFLGGEWDKNRMANFTLNALLGAGGGAAISKGNLYGGGALIGFAPGKDLMLSLQSTVNKGNKVLDATAATLKNSPTDSLNNTLKWVGGGALGLGGLALLAKALKKDKATATHLPSTGTLKYKILGKKDDPNDDIEVELPVDTTKFTPDMNAQIDSYIKRQAKKAIRNNARKRDPETGKLIPYELYMKKYGPIKSASFMDGLTNKPVPEYKKEETETPSTTKEFYRLQAGAKLNNGGATVKSARVKHEAAGSLMQGVLRAGTGAALGAALADQVKAPMGLFSAVGGLAGVALPAVAGRALARKENIRSIEEQKEHDSATPLGEYLIPGYAEYQRERRDMLDRKILSDSFEAAGMNPIPKNHTPEHSKDTSMASDDEYEDAIADEDEEEPYDIIEKYAGQAPPPPAPKAGVGSGPAPAPVKAPASTAVTNAQLGSMQNVQHSMRDLTSRLQNTKLS